MTHEWEALLVEAAQEARKRAYCPYSGFAVGAALLSSDGQPFVGCNTENASYGLTICAERAAVCAAISAGHHQWSALAVVSSQAAPPCGACRQVLAEFCDDLSILLVDADDVHGWQRTTLNELLPRRFRLE